MKGFSKAIIILLMILSLALLASCGKDDGDKDDKTNETPGVIIDPDGGVSLPPIPWPVD